MFVRVLNALFTVISIRRLPIRTRRFYLTGDVTNLKACWDDHLVSYLPLMYRYEINTNILHLTFPRAKF